MGTGERPIGAAKGSLTNTMASRQAPPPPQSNGGCRLLPKRAKKHSIAADCGGLKATCGPRLRGAAEQKVEQ